MPSGSTRLRMYTLASALALLGACSGAVDEGTSGNARHTADDVQKMKFVMGFRNHLGQPCRVFEQTVSISGQKTGATSTMCQQPDGRWTVEEER